MKRLRSVLALALVLGGLLPFSPGHARTTAPTSLTAGLAPLASLPEMQTAISIGFIRDTMFVSTTLGLYSYDVSDPASPELLGALPMYLWENEDVTVDPQRELVFISRDSRGFTTHYVPRAIVPLGILHVVDVSDPAAMSLLSSTVLPVGHTASCVERCRYIWTAGIVRGAPPESPRGSRAVWATDMRDPAEPRVCGPFDSGGTGTNDTYGSHDVSWDPSGVAWVSGDGGVWGYWTRGRHRDPRTGRIRLATGCDPIPYGGGQSPESATPGRYIHNASRNLAMRASRTAPRGTVLLATEENITSNCSTSGRVAAYDLRSSLGGRAWRGPRGEAANLTVLDTWTPEGQPGSTGCDSAHWFEDRGDGLMVYAFYGQGVRILDASNPRNIRQVAYYVPPLANAWAAYWHDGHVVVADYNRGVEILDFTEGASGRTVVAPTRSSATASTKSGAVQGDPASGFVCALRPAVTGNG